MGADQSSPRSASSNVPGQTRSKTCYYEVLGIDRLATDDEIKKAYRRKALELHPDRNYGDVDNATTKFAEVQSAYQVLSDPQERAWYDSHRDSILRGDSGGASKEDQFEHNIYLTSATDIVVLISRFNPRVPFTDGSDGFYGILRDTFAKLAAEESSACDWEGLEPVEYPEFGGSKDSHEDVVRPFYRVWISFSTKKSFSWRDAYKSSDAPDRATRRLIEKENKRLRDEGTREFNDAVRALVAFVRKRDPRFIPNTQSESDRQKVLRDAAAAQAARSRAANLAKFDVHVVPDWAKTSPPEEEGGFPDSSESEVEHIECVVCGKIFKSEKQYETHEKSKKHIKAVQQLQREMRTENKRLNLDQPSEDESGKLSEELQKLEMVEADTDDVGVPTTDRFTEADEMNRGTEPFMENVSGVQNSNGNADCSAGDSDSSEGDDDYAPREDVQNRLTLSGIDNDIGVDDSDSIPKTGPIARDDSNTLPKLGKAKAKRAKKAARHETELQECDEFKCTACNNKFPSKTKLFNHIKELGHAQAVLKTGKGKNNKGH